MLATSTVDLVEQARRRSRLGALLGRLLLEEPGAGVAELVAGVPALEPLGRPDPAWGADYERLLVREVPLYESVFLGDDAQLGGPVAAAVSDAYVGHDFDEVERWRVAGPDHLGLELRCYARLCADEAAGWEDDRADQATLAVEAERSFLADHLGQWAEIAMAAVRRRAGTSPYAELAAAVGAFVAAETERLRPAPDHPGMPAVVVGGAPRRLGPARLARWLLVPARCGGYLDTDHLGAVARTLGIPWRPSDPRSRFRQVVEDAVDGGDLAALLAGVRPVVETWVEAHRASEEARDADRRVWRAWRLRAEQTLDLIDRFASTAPTEAPAAGPVVVRVPGGGTHAGPDALAALLARVRSVGVPFAVAVAPPPEVVAAVAPLLEAGAEEVLFATGPLRALWWLDHGDGSDRAGGQLDAPIVVRLEIGVEGPLEVVVVDGADVNLAARVRDALHSA